MVGRISPISVLDFSRVVHLCRPPSGWSNLEPLIVANSGGPDSACLLFLLHGYLDSLLGPPEKHQLPAVSENNIAKKLISLTIDHDLQRSSKTMAERAGDIARSLGVEHATMKLLWGQNDSPPKPRPNDKIEGIARAMRFKAIFKFMRMRRATTVALAHHADDQVETMLMRLGRGSSMYGLAGMKSCRRWGMGDLFERYGIEGMRKWVVRPLLPFGKDRILATCEAHKLNYIEDATNFQPAITVRNAIRHHLSRETSVSKKGSVISNRAYSNEIPYELKQIQLASEGGQLGFGLNSGLSHLREENQKIGAEVRQNEVFVGSFIEKYRMPSPPGSFMVAATDLKRIESVAVQEALLFQVTRHISPEPWGHPRAELGRSKASMMRLIECLSSTGKTQNSICVGSHVWWRPVVLGGGRARPLPKEGKIKPNELAWIAQRQPPESDNPRATVHRRIELDAEMAKHVRSDTNEVEILYDLRYLIRINTAKLPPAITKSLKAGGKLLIDSVRPWYIPQVKHKGETGDIQTVHTEVNWPYDWRKLFDYTRNMVASDWITVDYIRPIASL